MTSAELVRIRLEQVQYRPGPVHGFVTATGWSGRSQNATPQTQTSTAGPAPLDAAESGPGFGN
ncbi:hypothetical protein OG331_47350 [Streptomyces sp. NBC_01017]|uniref:hypothetical protein n=1 Tax=Streptomyces sp. NBC_01017 TaxID=2903721 RepID=UPI00386F7D31|nr:hypothetical protein OG331_04640 [Streptomyces sp. NBC_01017]WSV34694.1 hypothetical protein OG331_47350 [Streptomyces sp. NBC_01017]